MDIKKMFWHLNLLFRTYKFKHIGSYCYMGKPLSLVGTQNISLGNRVRIYPGCRMETHKGGQINIEDDCSIAQNFHITSGDSPLVIVKKTTISGNVFITNIDHEYQKIDKHIMEQPMICKKTVIGENCFIGFGAAIQAGTVLGKQCVVGTNAVVRGTYPDYSVIVGVPAKVVKRYNKETGKWERQ